MVIIYSEKQRKDVLKSDLRNAREYLTKLIEVKKERPSVFLIHKYYNELYEAYNEIDKAIDNLLNVILKIENENWDLVEELLYEQNYF